MRIYCDSNIFRKAKTTSSQFKEQVYKSLEILKSSFIFLFSDAHLHDLEKSSEHYRIEDLVHMESYVGNNYLHRDPIKKEFHYYLATPAQAFEGIDFKGMHEALEDQYTYVSSMFDFEGGEAFGKFFKAYFDMPLFDFPTVDADNLNPETKELIDSFKGVRTINDALKRLKGLDIMLDDKGLYRKHTGLLSNYINREDYNYEKWSFDFDEKMKDTVFSKTFQEMVDLTIAESDKNDEYTRFINTYTNLEFYGVTQETSGKKRRSKANSYWDIHKDATHAYYGSKADYLVSDDNGLLMKAFITYQLLGIKTEVLSPDELIEKTPFLLKNEELSKSFNDIVERAVSTGELLSESPEGDIRLYKLPFLVFNYFDRFQTTAFHEYYSLQFFRSENRGFMYAEIAKLIEKLEALFGANSVINCLNDLKSLGRFQDEEYIGQWANANYAITLTFEVNSFDERVICLSLLVLKAVDEDVAIRQ